MPASCSWPGRGRRDSLNKRLAGRGQPSGRSFAQQMKESMLMPDSNPEFIRSVQETDHLLLQGTVVEIAERLRQAQQLHEACDHEFRAAMAAAERDHADGGAIDVDRLWQLNGSELEAHSVVRWLKCKLLLMEAVVAGGS